MEPWFAVTTGTPFLLGAASWCSPKRDFRDPTPRSTSSTNWILLIVSHSKNYSTSSIPCPFGHKLFIEKKFSFSPKKYWTTLVSFRRFAIRFLLSTSPPWLRIVGRLPRLPRRALALEFAPVLLPNPCTPCGNRGGRPTIKLWRRALATFPRPPRPPNGYH